MGAITGAQAKMGAKVATTWDTATTITTSDQLDGVTIAVNENAEALSVPPIGSGLSMISATDRGNIAPSVSIAGPLCYNSPQQVGLAVFFGGCSVQAIGGGAYCQSIINNLNRAKFLTVAYQAHSATAGAVELPTVAFQKATIKQENPASYAELTLDGLASQVKIASTTNTYATLSATTAADSKRVVFSFASEFLINAQAGGALSSPTDRVNITGATLELEKPEEFALEAKGATGNGTPVATGDYPFTGKLTVTFRTLADFTYITAQQAGTEYKASLTTTGDTIGGGNAYTFQWNLPRIKIVESPEVGLQEAGNNPLTVTFQCLVAASAPTGMLSEAAGYPYCRVISTRATSLLA